MERLGRAPAQLAHPSPIRQPPFPGTVPELVTWLEKQYPAQDLRSSSQADTDAALLHAGARQLIAMLRARLDQQEPDL